MKRLVTNKQISKELFTEDFVITICNQQCQNNPGNTKGGSITVLLTSCLTGLESAVLQLTIFVFICKTD